MRASVPLILWLLAASPPAPKLPQRIIAALWLNEMPRGDVFPISRDGDFLVPVASLEEAGVSLRALGAAPEVVDGQAYVSLRALGSARFDFDERTSTLRVVLPPSAFPERRMDLGPIRPAGLEVSREPSGFLNYSFHVRNQALSLFSEAGATMDRGLFSTAVQWTAGAPPVRGLSQVALDFPEHLLRAVAGEAPVSGGVLGGSGVIAGAHLFRRFELNPAFARTSSPELSGAVTTPSTLEVYVNDRLVQQAQLPPGPYRLENLPLQNGPGTIRYVVRDAFGRESEVDSSYYFIGSLLAPGVSDYGVSLGIRREQLAAESFTYGAPLALATFRVGATRWLTPGLRLELSPELVSGGASALCQLPFGELELTGAASRQGEDSGVAGGMVFALRGPRAGVSAYVRAMSPGYANASLAPGHDRRLLDAGANVSLGLGARVMAGGQLAVSLSRDLGWSGRVGLTASARVRDDATLSLSASGVRSVSGANELQALVALTLRLDLKTSGALAYARAAEGGTASASVGRGVPIEGGFGYQAQASLGSAPNAQGRLQYLGPYGRYQGGVEWVAGQLAGTADVSGGVALIGGHVFFSRAIEQGFALVRVPGVEGVRVRLNNHEVGRTNAAGELIATGLLPYDVNRLSVTDEDLPLNTYLPGLEKRVAPRSRGGAVVEFRAEAIQAVRGRLALAEGAGAPAFGEITVLVAGAPVRSPVGRDGEFELLGLPPGRQRATVVYPHGRCTAELEVRPASGEVTELGTVRCLHE